jgi:predicted ester cyclase
MHMTAREFADKLIQAYNEALLEGDIKHLKDLENPDVVYHMGVRGDMVGSDAHEQNIIGSRLAFSDIKIDFKYLAGEGNIFALSYKARYTSNGSTTGLPPAGKVITSDQIFIYQLKNNKIAEVWANGYMTGLDM